MLSVCVEQTTNSESAASLSALITECDKHPSVRLSIFKKAGRPSTYAFPTVYDGGAIFLHCVHERWMYRVGGGGGELLKVATVAMSAHQ